MTEADQVSERAHDHLKQWPTLTEAMGCADCSRIYRVGHACPLCGSESVWNLAALLAGGEE